MHLSLDCCNSYPELSVNYYRIKSYTETYMSGQLLASHVQHHFTITKVAVNWQELKSLMLIMQPSSDCFDKYQYHSHHNNDICNRPFTEIIIIIIM